MHTESDPNQKEITGNSLSFSIFPVFPFSSQNYSKPLSLLFPEVSELVSTSQNVLSALRAIIVSPASCEQGGEIAALRVSGFRLLQLSGLPASPMVTATQHDDI